MTTYLAPALVDQGYTGSTAGTPYKPPTADQLTQLQTIYGTSFSGQVSSAPSATAIHININFDGTQNNGDQLLNERVELQSQQQRTVGELQKQTYRSGLLELRAAEDGVVKDMVTYTPGAVVQPGAVLLNLVPKDEPLLAEVAIRNEDVGFVAPGQKVKVKLQAYPFQKYGMLEGSVELVSADSLANDPQKATAQGQSPQSYKAVVKLASQELKASSGEVLKLTPGMVVQAEIHQGRRTVLEYLVSPVQKVAQEAGRER